MALFRRAPRSRFPADMLQWLAEFGRIEFDPLHSGVSYPIGQGPWTRLGPLLELSRQDPDGFFTELRALVATDRGGFATFGAARLAWELLGAQCLKTPAALPLVDAGIEFKLARGLPSMMLTGYEIERLAETRRTSERDR